MTQNDGRVHVGSAPFPYLAVGIAVVLLIAIMLGVAYSSRTPYGAEVTAPPGAETAVNDHLGKFSPRFPQRRLYYNCGSFSETMFSSDQDIAVAVEQGNWRPGVQAVEGQGDLEILRAIKKGDSPWEISSVSIPNSSFDPSAKSDSDPAHPCNVK